MSRLLNKIINKPIDAAVNILCDAYEEKQAFMIKRALTEDSRNALIGAIAGAGIGGLGATASNIIKGKKMSLRDAIYGSLLGAVPGSAVGYFAGNKLAPYAPSYLKDLINKKLPITESSDIVKLPPAAVPPNVPQNPSSGASKAPSGPTGNAPTTENTPTAWSGGNNNNTSAVGSVNSFLKGDLTNEKGNTLRVIDLIPEGSSNVLGALKGGLGSAADFAKNQIEQTPVAQALINRYSAEENIPISDETKDLAKDVIDNKIPLGNALAIDSASRLSRPSTSSGNFPSSSDVLAKIMKNTPPLKGKYKDKEQMDAINELIYKQKGSTAPGTLARAIKDEYDKSDIYENNPVVNYVKETAPMLKTEIGAGADLLADKLGLKGWSQPGTFTRAGLNKYKDVESLQKAIKELEAERGSPPSFIDPSNW